MTDVYNKSLSKVDIFNLSQNAHPIGDVLNTKLKVIGVHHKTVNTAEGEEKRLTILFVQEDDTVKSYFSSASSFYNGVEDILNLFGEDMKSKPVEFTVTQVETRNNNTVYVLKL